MNTQGMHALDLLTFKVSDDIELKIHASFTDLLRLELSASRLTHINHPHPLCHSERCSPKSKLLIWTELGG